MIIKKLALIIMICFVSSGFNSGCQDQQDDQIIHMSPDVRAELVFFFRRGTDWKEIFEFNRTVIAVPAPNGTGFSSLPGMMSVVKIEVNGYEGEAINFKPNA